MLLPSPFYGQAASTWSIRTVWLALALGLGLGLGAGLLFKTLQKTDNRGQLIKKATIQAFAAEDLNAINQQLHLLIPLLQDAHKSEAQRVLAAVEEARFGQQGLDPHLIKQVKQWDLSS